MSKDQVEKKFTVVLREGGGVHFVKAVEVTLSTSGNFMFLNDAGGKHVAVYPTEALAGIVETEHVTD